MSVRQNMCSCHHCHISERRGSATGTHFPAVSAVRGEQKKRCGALLPALPATPPQALPPQPCAPDQARYLYSFRSVASRSRNSRSIRLSMRFLITVGLGRKRELSCRVTWIHTAANLDFGSRVNVKSTAPVRSNPQHGAWHEQLPGTCRAAAVHL